MEGSSQAHEVRPLRSKTRSIRGQGALYGPGEKTRTPHGYYDRRSTHAREKSLNRFGGPRNAGTPMRCVFHVRLASARDPGPLHGCPWRDRGLVTVVGPSAGEVWRNALGPTTADRTGESASATWGNKATVLVCCWSPSRHVRQGCERRGRSATLCKVHNPAAGSNGAKREWNG